MGPQHESCGKYTQAQCSRLASAASMGPQHESCGKMVQQLPTETEGELQWGRNMRVAESNSEQLRYLSMVGFNGAAT